VKDYNTAQRFFLEALKRSGGAYTQAFFPLADIFRDKGDPENLRLCYQQILYDDPANPDARAGLENITPIRNQVPDIRQPEQPGSDATIFFNNGNRKYREGDYSGAVADFSKAIRLNPRYAKAYNNRGIVFAFALKQYEDAKRDFDSAISLNRDYGDAYLGRGSVLFHLRNFEGACRDWRRSADLGIARAAELLELHCKDR
jgi:tetratricopeptide (TPR) repeat protein